MRSLFARALNIPFAQHQLDHQNILAAIDITRREIGKDSAVTLYAAEHCAQFLRNWLIRHITEEDLLMKPVLQTRPYDFKIDGVGLMAVSELDSITVKRGKHYCHCGTSSDQRVLFQGSIMILIWKEHFECRECNAGFRT